MRSRLSRRPRADPPGLPADRRPAPLRGVGLRDARALRRRRRGRPWAGWPPPSATAWTPRSRRARPGRHRDPRPALQGRALSINVSPEALVSPEVAPSSTPRPAASDGSCSRSPSAPRRGLRGAHPRARPRSRGGRRGRRRRRGRRLRGARARRAPASRVRQARPRPRRRCRRRPHKLAVIEAIGLFAAASTPSSWPRASSAAPSTARSPAWRWSSGRATSSGVPPGRSSPSASSGRGAAHRDLVDREGADRRGPILDAAAARRRAPAAASSWCRRRGRPVGLAMPAGQDGTAAARS